MEPNNVCAVSASYAAVANKQQRRGAREGEAGLRTVDGRRTAGHHNLVWRKQQGEELDGSKKDQGLDL